MGTAWRDGARIAEAVHINRHGGGLICRGDVEACMLTQMARRTSCPTRKRQDYSTRYLQ